MSVTKTAAALLVVGLVVGVGIGYGIGFMSYQPEIDRIKEACVQLEKDRAFLNELAMYHMHTPGYGSTVAVPDTKTLTHALEMLSMIREKSGDVNPLLSSKVDAIMDDVKAIFDWRKVRAPPEDATWEEVASWEHEGLDLLDQYVYDYNRFEEAYISAIRSHIKAVTELTES